MLSYVCLRKDHLSRDLECKFNVKCFTCGGRHHVSICGSNLPKTENKTEQRDKARQEDQSKPDHPQVTMFIRSPTPILLQSAKTIIHRTGSAEQGVKARIILDSGSQRSYITNCLKDGLSLPVECQEKMLIKTFGSQNEKLQTCDAVSFSVKLPDGKKHKDVSLFCTTHLSAAYWSDSSPGKEHVQAPQ